MSINVRRLKEIIIEKGLSCSELAAITGVSKAQIYRLIYLIQLQKINAQLFYDQ